MYPQAEDINPELAFRPRQKEKMKLRRNIRGNDEMTLKKVKFII
jgi:hypothetical protein